MAQEKNGEPRVRTLSLPKSLVTRLRIAALQQGHSNPSQLAERILSDALENGLGRFKAEH